MNKFVIHNGEIKPWDQPVIHVNNRGFCYGDGIFESIRVIEGKPCFLDAHCVRYTESLQVFRMEEPMGLNKDSLGSKIEELANLNGLVSGRCRLTIYRKSGGFYSPEKNSTGYTIELEELEENNYILNDIGVNTDIYPEMRKAVNMLSVHKTLNAHFYIMAAIWSQSKGLDNCLIQNERGNIIEASNSNLFIVSNSVLYTPALSDGCLGGVMRAQVINAAIKNQIKVYECSLNPQNLLAADELFLTNAIAGIQWVSTYRTKKYVDRMSRQLVEMLNQEVLSS